MQVLTGSLYKCGAVLAAAALFILTVACPVRAADSLCSLTHNGRNALVPGGEKTELGFDGEVVCSYSQTLTERGDLTQAADQTKASLPEDRVFGIGVNDDFPFWIIPVVYLLGILLWRLIRKRKGDGPGRGSD